MYKKRGTGYPAPDKKWGEGWPSSAPILNWLSQWVAVTREDNPDHCFCTQCALAHFSMEAPYQVYSHFGIMGMCLSHAKEWSQQHRYPLPRLSEAARARYESMVPEHMSCEEGGDDE